MGTLAVSLRSREPGQLVGRRGGEQSFNCGWLHNIGNILLLRNGFAGHKMLLAENNESLMLQSEIAADGCSHAQIGSLTANRPGLPGGVCDTILKHHNPSQCQQFAIVGTADLCRRYDFKPQWFWLTRFWESISR